MSITTVKVTAADLETFPADGKRYEVIEGELYVAAAPDRRHQALQRDVLLEIGILLRRTRTGQVFPAPVDVRFSDEDQVQPDLVYLRNEHLEIYRGSTVFGPPDAVFEFVSPSSKGYDAKLKYRLYEANGVPEYWLGDPMDEAFRLFVLRDGRYVEVQPEDGVLRSTVIPEFALDIAAIFASLD